jgi:hypothetical protein
MLSTFGFEQCGFFYMLTLEVTCDLCFQGHIQKTCDSHFAIARLAQWLERQRKDLVILTSRVRIPLSEMDAVPSDETV